MIYPLLWIAASLCCLQIDSLQLHFNHVTRLRPLSMSFIETAVKQNVDTSGMTFSSLEGKLLLSQKYPANLNEVKSIIPKDTFQKSTYVSLKYAALDLITTSFSAFIGIKYLLPLAFTFFYSSNPINQLAGVALWMFYSVVTGTCAIGMWVTAHECGHGAFSDNRKLQDFVGYIYHSLMLVPYYAWQRSHAVHHANTNHVTDGETHVPPINANPSKHISNKSIIQKVFGKYIGEAIYGWGQILLHLLVGWPAYLLIGATGGSSRGLTNHFVPIQIPTAGQSVKEMKRLFPNMSLKMLISDIGVVGVLVGLYQLALKFGWNWIIAAYFGPYLVINAWLVGYTWLQHTEVDIPHLPANNFSFLKGAFHTVDRPYDQLLYGLVDFLHHHIGSTHGKFINISVFIT